MLRYLSIALGTLALGLLAIGACAPTTWAVERSLLIEAPRHEVHAVLTDLESWPEWTPWSRELDPDAAWTFAGTRGAPGASMTWRGDPRTLGDGALTLASADPETGLSYDLVLKEGRARTEGGFRYDATPEGTRVTWWDRGDFGRRPLGGLFGFFAADLIEERVGEDFERGLRQLAQRLAGAESAPSTPIPETDR